MALARGGSRRSVGHSYGVSPDAVWRHWAKHVDDSVKGSLKADYLRPSATVAEILREEEPALLERLAAYRAGAWHLYNLAVEAGDAKGLAPLLRELREIEQFIARQTGELRERTSQPVQHVHLSPDWLRLQKTLLQVLRPFPEARAAVAAVLMNSERDHQPVIEGEVIHGGT